MKKNYLHPTHRVLLPLLWALLAVSQATWAQSIPDPQWARVGNRVAITNDGNIATSGELSSGPQGIRPRQVVKYDLQGNVLWQSGALVGQSYLGGKLPTPGTCPCVGGYAIIENILHMNPAPDGGIRLTGSEYGGRGVITSLNAAGQQGYRDYGGGTNAMLATPDGGNLNLNTTRELTSAGVEKTVVSVEKTEKSPFTTKIAYPNPPNFTGGLTYGNTVINTPDGGFLIVGLYNQYGTDRGATFAHQGWMAKLDAAGNVSWQKLISAPGPNYSKQLSFIMDAIVSADGTGYTLVGQIDYSTTLVVEIDFNGDVKTGRVKVIEGQQASNAYITPYTGSGGKKYYAVGNTAQTGRLDPQIRLVDSNDLSSVASRVFPGPGESRLTNIATAGDGSLVFVTDNNQLVKLQPEPIIQPPVGALTLTTPTYNCTTGAFTFNTSGGNGSTIEYMAPGITGWTTNPNQFVDEGSRTALDVQPFTLMARQNGVTVTLLWDLRAFCNGGPPQPPVGALTLTAPTYNCATGAFTFNTTGGNGNTIEYMAPGITGWTTNPNQFVDEGSRTALDVQPFTLMARQNGVTVTLIWDLRAYCNGGPPQPPVNPPTGALTLTAPTYNCATGAFTFNTTGGNGSLIEYMAPGITGWTTNPNQFVDEGSRTANDVQPFTLSARQNGVTVTLVWNLKAACGRARLAALPEPGTGLRVRVLGNPVLNQTAEVDITGAERQAVQLNLVDLQGRVLHQQRIEQAQALQRVRVPVGAGSGVLLLNVSTPTQSQQVKLLKP